MDTLSRGVDLRAQVARWRKQGARIGFVPTLGNLHEGHFSLIRLARTRADRVVASVFVNPTQFGPHEDFSAYPRTLAQDQAGLAACGCDLLFAPGIEEIYPLGAAAGVRIEVPGLSDLLEGASRPGHFSGVATVVIKLLNLAQPDLAVFGQKDYQQLLVIRRLVGDLALPIEIVAAPTLRESNGLAMSSRNQYLSAEERSRAGVIFQALTAMHAALRSGQALAQIQGQAAQTLDAAGLILDYAVLRRADNLLEPDVGQRNGLVGLVAARLGRARLIDNLLLDL